MILILAALLAMPPRVHVESDRAIVVTTQYAQVWVSCRGEACAPEDIDCDGWITRRDVAFWLTAWAIRSELADMTRDMVLDLHDVAAAMEAYGRPLPP